MDAALTHLLTFVQAWSRAAADARANRESRMDDEQWWAAAAYDPEHAYRFGLQVILDGLAAQLPGSGLPTGGGAI